MLANVCEKLGDLDECERQYKKVMELDPYFAAAYNNLGYTWIENDMKIEEAMEYVRKALELEPESGAYIDSLGWGYFKQGKVDEALAELLRALKYESTDPTVFDHIGDVYKAKKMIREAVEYWEKALEMNPNNQKIRKKIEQHQGALPPTQKKDQPENSE
jgi:tetratricopeptide (TPR) repeat protein